MDVEAKSVKKWVGSRMVELWMVVTLVRDLHRASSDGVCLNLRARDISRSKSVCIELPM